MIPLSRMRSETYISLEHERPRLLVCMVVLQGSTSLHLAAQSGHCAVVSLLLSKSTQQLHCKDKRGRTGLHLAAANGHLDMVSLLLGQGADIDVYDRVGMG